MGFLRFALETIDPSDFLAGQPIDIDVSSALDPLIDTIRPFVLKASLLVGGIFGLYLILILVRVYYERRKVKLLKGIKFNLDVMNEHHEVASSRQRKGLMQRFVQKIRGHHDHVPESKKTDSKGSKKKK